jgi:1-acyl-sn-glycerol-3-phosphate acyltransferase
MQPETSTFLTPFPPVHPLVPWRLSKALGSTVFALVQARCGRPANQVLASWARRVLSALNVEVRLASPLPLGGQLWVCNHLSWLDPLVCLQLRPSPSLAKAEVAEYPLIGSTMRRLGLRFVRRKQPISRAAILARLAADLRKGEELLLFPEGTTTRGTSLAPLYEGSVRAAYRMGIPVLPLRLFSREAHYPWTGDESLLPHLMGLAKARRTSVLIQPGPLLLPEAFSSEGHWLLAIEQHLSPHVQDLRACFKNPASRDGVQPRDPARQDPQLDAGPSCKDPNAAGRAAGRRPEGLGRRASPGGVRRLVRRTRYGLRRLPCRARPALPARPVRFLKPALGGCA